MQQIEQQIVDSPLSPAQNAGPVNSTLKNSTLKNVRNPWHGGGLWGTIASDWIMSVCIGLMGGLWQFGSLRILTWIPNLAIWLIGFALSFGVSCIVWLPDILIQIVQPKGAQDAGLIISRLKMHNPKLSQTEEQQIRAIVGGDEPLPAEFNDVLTHSTLLNGTVDFEKYYALIKILRKKQQGGRRERAPKRTAASTSGRVYVGPNGGRYTVTASGTKRYVK